MNGVMRTCPKHHFHFKEVVEIKDVIFMFFNFAILIGI